MHKYLTWMSGLFVVAILIAFWARTGQPERSRSLYEKKVQSLAKSSLVEPPLLKRDNYLASLEATARHLSPVVNERIDAKSDDEKVLSHSDQSIMLVANDNQESEEPIDFEQQFSIAYDSIKSLPAADQRELAESQSSHEANTPGPQFSPTDESIRRLPPIKKPESDLQTGMKEDQHSELFLATDESITNLPPVKNLESMRTYLRPAADAAPVPNVPQLARLPDEFEVDQKASSGNDFVPAPEKGAVHEADVLADANPNESLDFPVAEPARPAEEVNDAIFWWKELVNQPLKEADAVQTTDTNTLIYAALKNSPRIQAISKDPLIRELQVGEAESEFDPISFLNSQFDDRNDPVGNTLTTGGADFLKDNIWSGELGVRKKLYSGANVELGQRLGFQNSNSRFFVPQDQGTATLSLNFTQPLLRGRGRFYNQSQILIAQSAGGVAWEGFKAELQEELESVVEAYWRLYFERSVYLQKKRNISRGEVILELLEGRRELDSLPNQIVRAKSAVLSRKTELVNAFNDVRNSETEVRRLIADPDWLSNQNVELLPLESATKTEPSIPLPQVVETALENRPEIKESLQRARIAAIQHDVSTNELLPDLSLLMSGYISALEGGSGIELAITRQFENTPGYSVGFEFEFPINNRAARSRLAQRNVQRAKIASEVNEIMQNVIAESQVAHRRLTTAYQTMEAARVAIDAARADLDQNQQRWESFALVEGDLADGQSPTTVLDQLLDSQDRLTATEFVYSQAELELKLAEVGLRRVMGTLLLYERVSFSQQYDCDTPTMSLERDQSMGTPIDSPVIPVEPELKGTENQPTIDEEAPGGTIRSQDGDSRKSGPTYFYPLDESSSP